MMSKYLVTHRTNGKLGKSSAGSGRTNEVGVDIATPLRVPLSLHESVKSLIKLHRGKASCPQMYAAVAMFSVFEVFGQNLDSLPTWSAESFQIKKYLNKLLEQMYVVYNEIEKTAENDSIIVSLESLLDKVDYTFSDLSLYRELREKLPFIESVELKIKLLGFSV
jgi:hypothetical protein